MGFQEGRKIQKTGKDTKIFSINAKDGTLQLLTTTLYSFALMERLNLFQM